MTNPSIPKNLADRDRILFSQSRYMRESKLRKLLGDVRILLEKTAIYKSTHFRNCTVDLRRTFRKRRGTLNHTFRHREINRGVFLCPAELGAASSTTISSAEERNPVVAERERVTKRRAERSGLSARPQAARGISFSLVSFFPLSGKSSLEERSSLALPTTVLYY